MITQHPLELIIRLLEAATFMAGVPMLQQRDGATYIADDGNNIFLHITQLGVPVDLRLRIREGYAEYDFIKAKVAIIEQLIEQITGDHSLPFGNRWEHATRNTHLNYDRKRP